VIVVPYDDAPSNAAESAATALNRNIPERFIASPWYLGGLQTLWVTPADVHMTVKDASVLSDYNILAARRDKSSRFASNPCAKIGFIGKRLSAGMDK
jgi:hypothetical protein